MTVERTLMMKLWRIAVFSILSILILLPFAIILSHPTTGRVTGQVFDAKGPVPYARVIVSFHDWHLHPVTDTSPHDIGLEADKEGKFTVTREFDFRVGLISVHACSPSNELGWTHVREPRNSDEPVIVKVGRRIDNQWRDKYQYKYYRSDDKIIFVGKGWPPPPNDPYFDN